jgi:hypothetical protein
MRNENVILVAKILSCHANQVEGWNWLGLAISGC